MVEVPTPLHARLTDVGLEEKEADVVILLSTSTPLKASEVGRQIGISRMDSYNTLKRLQERGLVMATLDKPMRFTGLSISDVFQQLINHEEQELRRIKAHYDEFNDGNSSISMSDVSSLKEPSFSVVKERSYIQAAIERIIDDAEMSVFLILGKYGILHLVKTGALKAANEAATRGVSVKVLACLDKATLKFYEQLDSAVEIRHSESVSMHGCIVDGDVAVQNVSMESNPVGRGKEDAALVIEAREFLTAQTDLINATWKSATPLSTARTFVELGENTEPLQINLGAGSFYRRFKEIVSRDIEDQHPDNKNWTNAILREGDKFLTSQPHLPELELLGIDVSELMRIVGRRIGEEIVTNTEDSTQTDQEFWEYLSKEWADMGMGEMEIIGNPPQSIRIHDSGSCGKAPQFGGPFCHLDEGILEGIVEAKFGVKAAAVERQCTDEDSKHCRIDIIFDQLDT
jgi:sugar-specific transcriptional regulator TrmB/predicted hydrocarbon binding protein